MNTSLNRKALMCIILVHCHTKVHRAVGNGLEVHLEALNEVKMAGMLYSLHIVVEY